MTSLVCREADACIFAHGERELKPRMFDSDLNRYGHSSQFSFRFSPVIKIVELLGVFQRFFLPASPGPPVLILASERVFERLEA